MCDNLNSKLSFTQAQFKQPWKWHKQSKHRPIPSRSESQASASNVLSINLLKEANKSVYLRSKYV